jgi:GntR family transcriptional regulator
MPPVRLEPLIDAPLMRAPAYHQLNDRLRRLATSGEIPSGGRFPTERELAAKFGVSRVTANKALSQLVVEGVLEFRTGVGTFVRADSLAHDLGSLMSFTRTAKLSGRLPSTRVLEFRRTRGPGTPAGVREALRVTDDEDVFGFSRLRLADGIPVILERRHLRASACPGLTREDLAGSLYDRLLREPGLVLTGSEQDIRAMNLEPGDAELLGVPAGSAALRIHAVGQSGSGPIWIEDTLYRGDLYGFQNPLTLGRNIRPARVAPLMNQDRLGTIATA